MDDGYIILLILTILGFCTPNTIAILIEYLKQSDKKNCKITSSSRKSSKVTLDDIASIVGCNAATVSRALSNFPSINPDTKSKILATAAELNYELSPSRRKFPCRIGLIVPEVKMSEFAVIAETIDTALMKAGYFTVLCHTNDDPEAERECLERLRYLSVNGIIIASTGRNMSLIRDMHNQGIAVLQIIRRQDDKISSIVSDYKGGSYDAVHYLHGKGCRKIGLVNGPSHGRLALRPYRTRYDGYRRAVSELGLPEICEFTDGVINGYESGGKCIGKMLDENPELDAIMTAVDSYGMAALRIARERGIDVPGKLRVVSLTGCYVGHLLERSLTSFELPAKEIGTNAARMVIEEIESPVGGKPSIQHLTFAVSLSERESS